MFENTFSNIRSFFSNAYKTVSDGAHQLGEYIVSGAKAIVETPRNVITTVYADAKALVRGADADANAIFDRGTKVIQNVIGETSKVITSNVKTVGKTVGDLGESFANPLVIGAVALGALFLFKR